jgi:hypothetical protein
MNRPALWILLALLASAVLFYFETRPAYRSYFSGDDLDNLRWTFTVWLTYKSKEVAVMLPAGLLAYEWLVGRLQWKPLIPFVAISGNWGVQALISNSQLLRSSVCAMKLTPTRFWRMLSFYAAAIFAMPAWPEKDFSGGDYGAK